MQMRMMPAPKSRKGDRAGGDFICNQKRDWALDDVPCGCVRRDLYCAPLSPTTPRALKPAPELSILYPCGTQQY